MICRLSQTILIVNKESERELKREIILRLSSAEVQCRYALFSKLVNFGYMKKKLMARALLQIALIKKYGLT